ncbi:hypothetical protein [Lewinella sp. LCG006]
MVQSTWYNIYFKGRRQSPQIISVPVYLSGGQTDSAQPGKSNPYTLH